MTYQYTATEVIEAADKMRERGLNVPDAYLFNPSYMTSGEKALGFGTQSREPNSVANELIGLAMVGLATYPDNYRSGNDYCLAFLGGCWEIKEFSYISGEFLAKWKVISCESNPLAAVVSACVACLGKREVEA